MRKQERRPQVVLTPPRLQRRLMHNLEIAAHNKARPARAERAMAVLQKFNEKEKPDHISTPLVNGPTGATGGKSMPTAAKRSVSRIRKVLKAAVTKCAGRLRTFGLNFYRKGRRKVAAISPPAEAPAHRLRSVAFATNQTYPLTKNKLHNGGITMDAEKRREELTNELESYLSQACEAEAARDFEEAERCFKFAVFYEGKIRPEVGSAKQYATEAGPVYQKTPVAAGSNGLATHQN